MYGMVWYGCIYIYTIYRYICCTYCGLNVPGREVSSKAFMDELCSNVGGYRTSGAMGQV